MVKKISISFTIALFICLFIFPPILQTSGAAYTFQYDVNNQLNFIKKNEKVIYSFNNDENGNVLNKFAPVQVDARLNSGHRESRMRQ